MRRELFARFLFAVVVAIAAVPVLAQTFSLRSEYIRLGNRVIAVDSAIERLRPRQFDVHHVMGSTRSATFNPQYAIDSDRNTYATLELYSSNNVGADYDVLNLWDFPPPPGAIIRARVFVDAEFQFGTYTDPMGVANQVPRVNLGWRDHFFTTAMYDNLWTYNNVGSTAGWNGNPNYNIPRSVFSGTIEAANFPAGGAGSLYVFTEQGTTLASFTPPGSPSRILIYDCWIEYE